MKITSWNVNSVRARLARVLTWLDANKPDVLCLQETKVEDVKFPRAELESRGYRVELYGQKTYNGVAFVSKEEAKDVVKGLPDDGELGHRRVLAATFGGVRVVNVYVPNGEATDSPKFPFKLDWLGKLRAFIEREAVKGPLLVCGDFNIAPEDRDVHDPERWRGKVLFHPDEHAALARIRELPLHDAFRLKHEEGGQFTWWDYRMAAFQRGWGLRIDLHLVSDGLAKRCVDVVIDKAERKGEGASDHAPVTIELR
jgi:exodeoxyribonuclease-3